MKHFFKFGLILFALSLVACIVVGYIYMFSGDGEQAKRFLMGAGASGVMAFLFGSLWILLGGD